LASVLIIDSDLTLATGLAGELSRAIPRLSYAPPGLDVLVETDFSKARARLRAKAPKLMVTALQLREYNGIHLVYLAVAAGLPTRSLVHTDAPDPVQAREIRQAGAFYEVRPRLSAVLPGYVAALLPPHDRRDSIQFDRRRLARGGRRAADPRPSPPSAL
jgi:hypothetical protein